MPYTVAGIRTYIGAETTPGTSVPPTGEIHTTSMVDLNDTPTSVNDGRVIGKTPGSMILVSTLVGGGFNPIPRPNDRPSEITMGFLLGDHMDAPVNYGAAFRFWYSGSEKSAKITINNAGNYIQSAIGDLGAEVADANFISDATPGQISFADLAADTLSEAVALINGLSDYSAVKIAGPDTYDISTNAVLEIGRVVQQGKNAWVDVWFTGTSAWLKRITLPGESEELKTLSVQLEGRNPTNSRFTGITPLTGTLAGADGALVTLAGTVHGFSEEDSPAPASVPAVPSTTYAFWNKSFYVNGNNFRCVRSVNVVVTSNTTAEYCDSVPPSPSATGNLRDRYTVQATFDIEETPEGAALKEASLTKEFSQFRWLLYGDVIDAVNEITAMVILKGWGQFADAPSTANVNTVDRSVTMDMSDQTNNYMEPWEVIITTTDSNLW